jgi:hypothetical protein
VSGRRGNGTTGFSDDGSSVVAQQSVATTLGGESMVSPTHSTRQDPILVRCTPLGLGRRIRTPG